MNQLGTGFEEVHLEAMCILTDVYKEQVIEICSKNIYFSHFFISIIYQWFCYLCILKISKHAKCYSWRASHWMQRSIDLNMCICRNCNVKCKCNFCGCYCGWCLMMHIWTLFFLLFVFLTGTCWLWTGTHNFSQDKSRD